MSAGFRDRGFACVASRPFQDGFIRICVLTLCESRGRPYSFGLQITRSVLWGSVSVSLEFLLSCAYCGSRGVCVDVALDRFWL